MTALRKNGSFLVQTSRSPSPCPRRSPDARPGPCRWPRTPMSRPWTPGTFFRPTRMAL
ncbi:hypothetical protein ACFFX0_32600 [Citricoccus parietis]|uniref:Uncharacterized protein n=1 Tax=Citricoccus parietis TaxID=592307 RepID=A0ABV5G9U1_9MICC